MRITLLAQGPNAPLATARLTPWPKLFQNLRSTRETELTKEYPLHVVCAWIGNSQSIAAKHYLQVTEEHVRQAAEKAAQNPTQQPAARGCNNLQESTPDAAKTAIYLALRSDATPCDSKELHRLTPRGFEPRSRA
jgi:hypothetical protein